MPSKTELCQHKECSVGKADGWRTWANLMTLVRTIATVILTSLAVSQHSELLLFIGLACYWLGDTADGALARLLHQETRNGGVFDILSDRLCMATFYISYAGFHHEMILPIAVFLFNFMLVDNLLSLAFLKWPILSPNYFYVIDKTLYKLNWSRLAKAVNTGLFLIVVVLIQLSWLATVVAAAFLVIKLYSLWLLSKLPASNRLDRCALAKS